MDWGVVLVVLWMLAVLYYLQKISSRLYALAVGSDGTNALLTRIEDALEVRRLESESQDDDQP